MKKIITNSSRKLTNTNTCMSWVICMLLIFVAGIQSAQAQSFITWGTPSGTPNQIVGTYTGGTVTVTQSATGNNIIIGSYSSTTGLGGVVGPQGFKTEGPRTLTPSRSLIFTFSTPVIINALNINDIDFGGSWNDAFTFSGVTFTSVTGANCFFTTNSATPSGGDVGAGLEYANWVTSTTPVTSFTINYAINTQAAGLVTNDIMNYSMKVTVTPCNAGTTAPTLSATTAANVCPATTVNLTTITASNLPASTTLTWHTATPATTANKIATPSAVAAGTYYAAFFDATNNCYSGTGGDGSATTVVTATVTACCTAGIAVPTLSATTISNVCPTATVNLTTITASNLPASTSLTWHTATPATTANKIATPSAVAAGTYYAAFFDATNNCYSGTGGDGSATTAVTATVTACCTAGTSVPSLSATTISNVCPTATVNLTSITASNLPGSTTLTWHTATPATTANKIATPSAATAGTYYAAFFDASGNCYSGTGGNGSATTVVTATTTTCAGLTASNPSIQTVPGGQAYTGNAGTELAPTGGTSPYTYSNGSSDPACINPGGATALPPASNLTVTNSTTGAYTYTAPTASGTYFFCIKVCDSTSPTPSCVVKTYTVVVPCAAGSTPPVLIKN